MLIKKKVLTCLFLWIMFFGVILFSPYSLMMENWYTNFKLKQSITCIGKDKVIENITHLALSEDTAPLFNVSVAYFSPNKQLTTCVAGTQKHDKNSQLVNQQTTFLFASLTKILTSDAILSLVRNEQLKLDDRLVDLLPELNNQKFIDSRVKSITISDLLTHTAGFDRTKPWVGDLMFHTRTPWCPNNVEELTNTKLEFSPTGKFEYSNVGYCLLSRVIEEKHGFSYKDIIKQKYKFNNFKSLGFLKNTVNYPKDNSAILSLNPDYDYQAIESVAGLFGNPSDLVKLVSQIEKKQYPNITSKNNSKQCDTSDFFGCHGYMGYEYQKNKLLKLVWRDGIIDNGMALLVIDSDGGVMVLTSNMGMGLKFNKKVITHYYNLRLQD